MDKPGIPNPGHQARVKLKFGKIHSSAPPVAVVSRKIPLYFFDYRTE